MKSRLFAVVAMAVLSGSLNASSFAHLDNQGEADLGNPYLVSSDAYVKEFGLALQLIESASQTDDNGTGPMEPASRPNDQSTVGPGAKECGCEASAWAGVLTHVRNNVGTDVTAGTGQD